MHHVKMSSARCQPFRSDVDVPTGNQNGCGPRKYFHQVHLPSTSQYQAAFDTGLVSLRTPRCHNNKQSFVAGASMKIPLRVISLPLS